MNLLVHGARRYTLPWETRQRIYILKSLLSQLWPRGIGGVSSARMTGRYFSAHSFQMKRPIPRQRAKRIRRSPRVGPKMIRESSPPQALQSARKGATPQTPQAKIGKPQPQHKETSSLSSQNQVNSAQLQSVMIHSAIPMIGFGLMDQTIMLQAGNTIDCTIGVTLQLSTLTAAAVGQIFANAGGIVFGESLQNWTNGLWSLPTLTGPQWASQAVRRAKFSGTFLGLLLGCLLGLGNLWFIDTDRSSTLKLIQALADDQDRHEFAYEIQVQNHKLARDGQSATKLTVRGPDTDGLLASIVTAMTEEGCSLVELNARSKQGDGSIEDVFVVRRHGEAIPDEELQALAKRLVEATKLPLNVPTLAAKHKEMESENEELRARVERLEQEIEKRQIDVVLSISE